MIRHSLLALLIAATALPTIAAPKLLQEAQREAGALTIPYQLYRLDNGLTVILAPDHSDPLVHVDVTYHVGSAREVVGKSGFAHFFEHMMFQGSKHVPAGEYIRLVNQVGGEMNGSTNRDRTNYYATVPANQLERVLWLESDRMGFLLDAVDQKKFEIQRSTVKNERSERIDNQPYGRVNEVINAALYPATHPYSWQPIGYAADLDNGTLDDLRQFFLRWYGPNNATLTIGGDFEPQQVLAWVEHYFGAIPKGPEVAEPTAAPAQLDSDRYVTVEDNVHLPLLTISYPTVSLGAADEPKLDLLADILGGSPSSLLYQRLVKSGKAVQVKASHYCEELACSFQISAYANPMVNGDLAALKNEIDTIVSDFAERGVNQNDLEKARQSYRAEAIWGLDSVAGKVSQLAMGYTLAQDPNYLIKALSAIGLVTPESVMQAYQRYIAEQPAVIVSTVPQGKKRWEAGEVDYTLPDRSKLTPVATDEKPLPLREVKDKFDRDQLPASGKSIVRQVPSTWEGELANGIKILGSYSREIPAVSVTIAIPGGIRSEPQGQYGIATLTADLLEQGSLQHDQAALNDELQKLGATISFSTAQYNHLITVTSLKETLPQTLALVEEQLFKPALREEDFEKSKMRLLQQMQQQEQDPEWLAGTALRRLVYGEQNRLGYPATGQTDSLADLTLDEVKAYYKTTYNPTNARVVVNGDVNKEDLLPHLAFLTKGKKAEKLPNLKLKGASAEPAIYLIDNPEAAQSVIRMGQRAMPFDILGEHFTANLMNFNLGGNFNSRINQNLREQHGYTYGAQSTFIANRDVGAFALGTGVRSNATAAALGEILKELKRYRDQGISAEELAYLKSAVTQQDALSYETQEQKGRFLLQMIIYGLKSDFVTQQAAKIETLTAAQVQASAKKWLDPNQMVIVVVGDRAQLEEPLAELGLPVIPYQVN